MVSYLRFLFMFSMIMLTTAAAWAAAPTVSSTSPTTNKIAVSATSNITVTFDQEMDNATLSASTIKVHGNYRGYYSAVFSVSGNTVTVNPDSSFKAGEVITVTVTTGVENSIDEPMASPRVFNFTVDASVGYAKFSPPVNYTAYGAGSGNHYSVLADLDKDGDIDIASTTSLYNTMSVMLNNGNGTYASAVTYTTLNAFDISAADVDADGDMDLVVANNSVNGLSVFVNNGSGSFSTRNDYAFNAFQSNAQYLVTVDIDGDGDVDVVTNDLTFNYLHIMKNNGSGVFSSAGFDKAATTSFGALAYGDLDKDGDMDIVAACSSVDSVEHFINNGAGNLTFSTRYYWTNIDNPTSVLIADINSTFGDKQDLVWLNGGSGSSDTLTYFKDGSGVPLFTADNVGVGGFPIQVNAADVDTDNDLDLMVANYNDATFSLLTNTGSGSGTFTTTHTYTVPSYPDDMSMADLDGDGDMDVVTINNDATVSVFKNYNGGHVASVSPANGAKDISASSNITIVFDENINSGTLTSGTVKLIGSVSGAHAWTLSSYVAGTYTATINPTVDFAPGEAVSVVVSNGVQSSVNINLERGYTAQFVVAAGYGAAFGAKSDYSAGDQSQSVIAADVNADGYADIITANYLGNSISVLLNNGNGTFAAAVDYAAGNGPTSVAAGDVNGDGKVDLVATSTTDNQLSVFINNNNTGFNSRTAVSLTYGTAPQDIRLADVDGDGDLDAIYNIFGYVYYMTNNGSGSFSSGDNGANNSAPSGLAVVDFDNDGDLDFLSVNNGGNTVVLSRFNGTVWYGSTASYSTGVSPTCIATGDFNGDGYIDVVTGNLASGNGTISYLQNNQSSGLSAKVDYVLGAGAQPRGVAAVDIDSDGDLDLTVVNGAADSVVVFTNNGSGSFTKGSQFATGDNPYAIAAADIDGDGDMDIATANYTGDNISVLKGTTPVLISSIAPTANDLDIAVTSDVVITFNQAMNAGTLSTSSIKVHGSIHGQYTGTVSYNSGTLAATFDPGSSFEPGENITVLVTVGVQNVDGAALTSSYQWRFEVAASAEGTFGGRLNYALYGNPNRSAVADMNGDGAPDVVTVTSQWDEATSQSLARAEVVLNNGSGALGISDTTYIGSDNEYPNGLAVSDVDGDGDVDVVMTTYSGYVKILLNNGAGDLSVSATYFAGNSYNMYIGIGDLNGDGDNDIAVVLSDLDRVKTYANNGSGVFSVADSISTGLSYPAGIALSDVDGDGDMDILTNNYNSGTVALSKNNGNATFAAVTTFSSGLSSPDGIAAGDLNGDGAVDLAVSGWDNSQVTVLLNSGGGTFPTATVYANGNPSQIQLGDMDGDGDLDVVTTEASPYKIWIRANNGSGALAAASLSGFGNYPKGFSIADMDEDGDLDIVVAKDNNSVSVIKNIELVKVNSTSPSAHAIDINKTSNITATFNVDMNSATMVDSTVVVHGSITGKIAGSISYNSGSKTVTFNPTSDLVAGEEVSMTLTDDIKNTNGINLHSPLSTSFTVHADGAGNFVYHDSIPDLGQDASNYYYFASSLNSGDVTGDGKTDLLRIYNGSIKVLKNNTTSIDSISFMPASSTQDVRMADLNNDGHLDLMQSTYSNQKTPYLNDGNGQFTAQTTLSGGNMSPKVLLKDMDGDGFIDFTEVNGSGSQQVITYYNNGTGNYYGTNYSILTIHYDMYDYNGADVNNDGLNDLITLHSGNGNNFVSISMNSGERSFASPVDYTIAEGGKKMSMADVNGDGFLDIIVSNQYGLFFSVLLNNANGTFATAVNYSLGIEIYQVEAADMDGDGDQDVVVRGYDDNTSTNKLVMAYNNGSGGFGNQIEFNIKTAAPDYYYGYSNFTLVDYDSDGDFDIAMQAQHYYGSDQYVNMLLFENVSGSSSAPTVAASGITTSNNYGSSIKINWTKGNGARRLVLVKKGSAVNAVPSNNANFAPSTQFGTGTELVTGNYAVYGGVGSSMTLTNLDLSAQYHVAVFEMNGSPGSEQVLTTSAPTASFTTSTIAGYPFDTTAGSSLAFNGSSTIVDLPIPQVPDDMTISLWVKVTNSSNTASFFTRGPNDGHGGGGDRSVNRGDGTTDVKKISAHKKEGRQLKAEHSRISKQLGVAAAPDADNSYPINIGIDNGHFYASVYDDDDESPVTISGSTSVASGQWYHVAMTMNADGDIHFYVNGVEDGSPANVYFYDSGDRFILGSDGTTFFDGQIDEVQIRNSVRSISDIRSSMHRTVSGFPTDIVGYWQFNQGSGTTASDIIGGYDATLTDANWTASAVPIGHGNAVITSSFQSGTAAIGNASLTMSDGFDNPVDVVVSEVSAAPNVWPTGYSTSVGGKVFVIEVFGNPGTFSASLTLNFGANVLDPSVDGTPGTLRLFHRSATSTGAWTDLGGAASASRATGNVTWTGITSFSQFVVGDQNNPLPVELTSFSADLKASSVELKWSTATEINNHGFDVERKIRGEKSDWTKIGFIEGSGNSNAPKEYSYVDGNVKHGSYLYRLKQVDQNGRFSYSREVEVMTGAVPKVFALSQNYPNPFNPSTTIEFTLQNTGLTTLKVYNAVGQEVATLVNEVLEAGVYHQKQFNAGKLASGVYFARLTSGSQSQLKKLLLIK
jgi:methionine-rich copper-binding protein CopC